MQHDVTIWYLELKSPAQFRSDGTQPAGCRFSQVDPPRPEVNRHFYLTVGRDWNWIDRRHWTLDDWRTCVSINGSETWLLTVDEVEAGYGELDLRFPRRQIAYFGLLPEFTGRKLGGWLLERLVQRAWHSGGEKVCLNTCSLDHPAALKFYLAHGFEIERQEQKQVPLSQSSIAAG